MALSEREQRLLSEIERELEGQRSRLLAGLRAVVLRTWLPLVLSACALATIVLVMVFAVGPIAVPLVAASSAVAGYAVCRTLNGRSGSL